MRSWLLPAFVLLLLAGAARALAENEPVLPVYPEVMPGRTFHFPRDHGAHPAFRTEWWYVTGWLDDPQGHALGFQVTFFRSRPAMDARNPSAFAPRQILFAHAALSDPRLGRLLHDERAARAGFGLAESSTMDADIVLGDWSFKRHTDDRFHARVKGKDFALDLTFAPAQPVLLEGDRGYSRKGPESSEASYYYSLPHLKVSGSVRRGGQESPVTGEAWLDREWSSSLLGPKAVGWDWVGLNLDDGGALMAFRIRDAGGNAIWAGGTFRDAKGSITRFRPEDVRFTVLRRWHSPRTGADYPVEPVLTVRLPQGERSFRLIPLFDDQELDSAEAGPVYWEGAVKTAGGRGYLELTGYVQPLKL